MDMRIHAAMRALEAGDPLAALQHVALQDDAPSLALRGIALAQIGDLARAHKLLARAARLFGAREPLARARCITALAEVALAARELGVPLAALSGALQTLTAAGDSLNALHARLTLARSHITLGQLPRAKDVLADVRLRGMPAALVASAELVRAELALRGLDASGAQSALERGRRAAEQAGLPALQREIARVTEALHAPAARLICDGHTRRLSWLELLRELPGRHWLVDAFARSLRFHGRTLSLARRPVLFCLLRALAEAWPAAVPRRALIAHGFGVTTANDTHRARLRVELGRLRKLFSGFGSLHADGDGYRLELARGAHAAVLLPAVEGEEAELLALLGDGVCWSSSALARALGLSQRSLQRQLLALEGQGAVRSVGRGRAQRWLAPPIAGMGLQLLGLFQPGALRNP